MSEKMAVTQSDSKLQNKYAIFDPDPHLTINILPSTVDIPDEYEHKDNRMGLVIIFYSKGDEKNANIIKTTLSGLKYEIPESNFIKLSTKRNVLERLKSFSEKEHTDKTCLILIMMGNGNMKSEFISDDTTNSDPILIKDVWETLFTGKLLYSFREKPKIFIFQFTKPTEHIMSIIQADSVKFNTPPEEAYYVPSEADMLLVYKRIDDEAERNSFIPKLCNNFDRFGKIDNIIELVQETNYLEENRPVLISTLTRKFYLIPNEHRGRIFNFHEYQSSTQEILSKLRDGIDRFETNGKSRNSIPSSVKNQRTAFVTQATPSRRPPTRPPADDAVDSSIDNARRPKPRSGIRPQPRSRPQALPQSRPPWR